MDDAALRDILEHACATRPPAWSEGHLGECYVEIAAEDLWPAVRAIEGGEALHHLSAITGQDLGHALEVLYHLWVGHRPGAAGRGLTLRVCCPRDGATLRSLMDLLPAADWYEREVAEMLGVRFAGRAHAEHLLLPDDWEGAPPLRRPDPEEAQP